MKFLACRFAAVLMIIGGCQGRHAARDDSPPIAMLQNQLHDSHQQLRWLAAHRGVRSFAADNSLAALIEAAQQKIPLVEFDIRTSKEGELFLFHDSHISREQFVNAAEYDGQLFSQLPGSVIRTLVLADRWRSRIPTLAEALQALREYPVLILPEVKEATPASLQRFVRTIQEERFENRTIFQCSSEENAKHMMVLAPAIKLAARVTEPQQISKAIPFRPIIIQIDESWMTPEILSAIEGSGAQVLIKTLDALGDTPQHRARLFEQGVDIILTDYPIAISDETTPVSK